MLVCVWINTHNRIECMPSACAVQPDPTTYYTQYATVPYTHTDYSTRVPFIVLLVECSVDRRARS